jgi:hypothetical protein
VTTRRELLVAGSAVVAATAGCTRGRVESARRSVASAATVDAPTGTSTVGVRRRWRTTLDVDASAVAVTDAASAADGTVLVGQVDEQRPLLLRTAADGSVEWVRLGRTGDAVGWFASVAVAPDGSGVAVGGRGQTGLLAEFTADGTVTWRRLAPGPDRFRLSAVRCGPAGGTFVFGSRNGSGDWSDRHSAWIVRLDGDGRIDWQRFYGRDVWSLRRAAVAGPDTYLLAVWKQTTVGVEQYDAVVCVSDGTVAWTDAYPGCRVADLGVDGRRYHLSATSGTGPDTVPESTALVATRPFGGDSTAAEKLRFDDEVVDCVAAPVDRGLFVACALASSPPRGVTVGPDGAVADAGPLADRPVGGLVRTADSLVLLGDDRTVDAVSVPP